MTRSIASLDRLATDSAWLRRLARALVDKRAARLARSARAQTQRMLAKLVLELPAAERDVLLLHYFERLAPAEIERRLGLDAGSLTRRIHQALDDLGSELDARHGIDAVAALAHPRVGGAAFKVIAAALLLVLVACLGLRRWLAPVDASSTPSTTSAAIGPTRFVGPAALVLQQLEIDQYACGLLAPPPPSPPTPMTGIVIDSADRPVSGATVACDGTITTTTADDGTFTLIPTTPRGCAPTATKNELVGIPPATDPGERMVIRIVPPVLVVHVREIDEMPIPGATVTLYNTQHAIIDRLTTGDDGSVNVPTTMRASLVITARGHTAKHFGVDPQRTRCIDAPCEFTARLYAMGEHLVEGRVVDRAGQPIGGVHVAAHATKLGAGDPILDDGALTDSEGRFQVWAEETDTYTVSASLPDDEANAEVIVPSTSTTSLTLPLDPPKYPPIDVEVTVVDLQDRPVPNAELAVGRSVFHFRRWDNPPHHVDASGHANFRVRAREGDLSVSARRDGETSEEQRIQLVDSHDQPLGTRTPIALTLRLAPAHLAGVVVDERGRPLARASVDLSRNMGHTVADQQGRFEITPVRGARYELSASPPWCRNGSYGRGGRGSLVIDQLRDDLRIVVRGDPPHSP